MGAPDDRMWSAWCGGKFLEDAISIHRQEVTMTVSKMTTERQLHARWTDSHLLRPTIRHTAGSRPADGSYMASAARAPKRRARLLAVSLLAVIAFGVGACSSGGTGANTTTTGGGTNSGGGTGGGGGDTTTTHLGQ